MSQIDDLIAKYVPDGVKHNILGDIAMTVSGLTGKSKVDFSGGNARYVSYKNAFANLAVDQSASDFVTINATERQNRLQVGDIVFTGSSETALEVGMSSVVTTEPIEPLYLNSFCFAIRLHDQGILMPGFAKYLFRSHRVREQIQRTASGVTRINISKSRFLGIRIPVPPLEVQREIVRILDNFTGLEAELEAELGARRQQYSFLRDQIIGEGASHAAQAETEVPQRPIGDLLLHLRTGLNPRANFVLNPPGARNYYVTVRELSGFDVVVDDRTNRVNDKGLELITKRSRLKSGDVLFSATGTIGRTALVKNEPVDWGIKEGVYSLTPDRKVLDSRFLIYVLGVSRILQSIIGLSEGSTVRSISMASLRRVNIPVPTLELQLEIVAFLDYFTTLHAELEAELAARRKQYEYYRDRLLTFEEVPA